MSTTAIGLGIDLGTSYCRVSVWKRNGVDIITNEDGNRQTATSVAFSDHGRLIGDNAMNQVSMNPRNTPFNVKRLMGRRFDDVDVQTDIKQLPFTIVNKDGRPYVRVEHRGTCLDLSPEEVSSMILAKLKETAESSLGRPITHAVITVPAAFNNAQRQATKDACVIAGLPLLSILNEPSAAALDYCLDKNWLGLRYVIVFDLGGGGLDVSLMTVASGVINVIAIAGDTHLGGEDIDTRLVNYFADEFRQRYHKDPLTNRRALARLRVKCERIKRNLSIAPSADLEIDTLLDGIDFYTSITRTRFETLCEDLFRRMLTPVEQVLSDVQLTVAHIHDVVLVGGSTRIPFVHHMISTFFNGKSPATGLNPDEAVARGAAIRAACLLGDPSEKLRGVELTDAISLPLSIVTGSTITPVIQRNITVGAKFSSAYSTTLNEQHSMSLSLFEGGIEPRHLHSILTLWGIRPAPAGVPQIQVHFVIQTDGGVSVTACEIIDGTLHSIAVKVENDRLSMDEITRMTTQLVRFKAEDEEDNLRMAAKNSLESYVYRMRDSAESEKLAHAFCVQEHARLETATNEALEWLERSREASKEEYEDIQRELDSMAATARQRVLRTSGRGLSRDELVHLTREANECQDTTPLVERVAAATRAKAKRDLEAYTFAAFGSVSNPKLAAITLPEDMTQLEQAITVCMSWLREAQEPSVEEYLERKSQLAEVFE